GRFFRQFRIGNYGVADIISVSRPYYNKLMNENVKGLITVYELKKDKISVSAFFQAVGYLKGIRTYLEKRGKEHLFNYCICLIGKNIDLNSTITFLPSLLIQDVGEIEIYDQSRTIVDIYEYHYDINGLSFKNASGYNLSNKGF